MYGKDILCAISKVPFEIPHKISYTYIDSCRFYPQVKILKPLDVTAYTCFWNAPLHQLLDLSIKRSVSGGA